MKDRELVALYLQRNLQAIEQTQAAYKVYCKGIARNIIEDEQQIGICVDRVWMQAWDLIPPAEPESLKHFVGKLARRNAIECLAKQLENGQPTGEIAVVLDELGDACTPYAEPLEHTEAAVHGLYACLQNLCERDRALFIRRYYYAERTDLLGLWCGLGADEVSRILALARADLQAELSKAGVTLTAVDLLLLIGEIEPAWIMQADEYKPTRPKAKKSKRVPKTPVIAAALVLVLLVAPILTVWFGDAYVQHEYPAYNGTVPDALDYILTKDQGPIPALLGQKGRDAVHAFFSSAREQHTAPPVVLHGSEGLMFTSLDKGLCIVSGMGTCKDTHVVVPMLSPKGEVVVGIGNNAFAGNIGIKGVTLPPTVLIIGEQAFIGCINLSEVRMSDSVMGMGAYAFAKCKSLQSFYLPAALMEFSPGVIRGCDSLEVLTCAPVSMFYYTEGNCVINATNAQLVTGCKTSVIPEGVESIRPYAFYELKGLTSLQIPEGVREVGEYAFSKCPDLVEVSCPQSLEIIERSAFEECAALERVTLPQTMSRIREAAFQNCDSLSKLSLPASVGEIDGGVFADCDALTEIEIPSAWSYLPSSLFVNCDRLALVRISGDLSYIGQSAFANCASLQEVQIMGKVEEIHALAFSNCAMKEIDLPEGLTLIGQKAFAQTNLTEVRLPESVHTLASGAFRDCEQLTGFYIPASLIILEDDVFAGCRSLAHLEVDANNEYYRCIGNCLIDYKSNAPRIVFGNQFSTIPEGVEIIGSGAFRNCEDLTSIYIPGWVTRIEPFAFDGCTQLRDIYCQRSESAWNRVDWDPELHDGLKNVTLHFDCEPKE